MAYFERAYDYYKTHEHVWFHSTKEDDLVIMKRFLPYLRDAAILDAEDASTLTPKQLIGAVIILDQVTRHARRQGVLSHDQVGSYTQKAFGLSKMLLEQDPKGLQPFDYLFGLLPFRHTRVSENILRSIQIMEQVESESGQGNQGICRRFLRAAYKDLLIVNNERYLVKREPWGDTPVETEQVVERGDIWIPYDVVTRAIVPMQWKQVFRQVIPPGAPPLVSLSGGVDSMVLLVALKASGYSPVAFHVNYLNREASSLEETFVAHLCKRLQVPYYVREFTEMQRKGTNRLVYEESTKEARFDGYRRVSNFEPSCVLLGHHKDDVLENIFSNITQGKKLESLHGMAAKAQLMGVTLVRPFLGFPKRDLLAFAHKYNIPYLKDTTDPNCARGKLRRTISGYDPRFLQGLLNIADHVRDLTKVAEAFCETILQDADLQGLEVIGSVSFRVPESMTKIIWRTLFLKLGILHVSHRSIENLVFKFQRPLRQDQPYGHHSLNKEYHLFWEHPGNSSKHVKILRVR